MTLGHRYFGDLFAYDRLLPEEKAEVIAYHQVACMSPEERAKREKDRAYARLRELADG